ncbi:MAG: lipopolysaccharide biosynthesis protein [Rhizobium sp.]|nr:lipopolysaccharide biosynthesis protein [Rhizobium sp.]
MNAILRHLSANQQILHAYFSVISGSAGRLVVSLAYFVVLANTLPITDYGVFATASGTGLVLSRLLALGFSSPLYRIAVVKPRLLGVYTTGYLVASILSLPLIAIAALLVYLLFFAGDVGFFTFSIVIITETLLWRSAEIVIIVNNGLKRFGLAAVLVIFGTAARAAAAGLFWNQSSVHDLDHWAWWYAGANAVSLVVALYFYPRVRLRFDPRLYLRRVQDSLAVAGAELLFYLQSELDKLMVLGIGGPALAGIYAIIMRVVDLTALPIRSFNTILVQKLMQSPDMLKSLKVRVAIEAGLMVVSVAGLATLAFLLHLYPNALGRNVAPVAELLPLVLLLPGFRNLAEYQGELMYARGHSWLRTTCLALLTLSKAGLITLLLYGFAHDGQDWIIALNGVFAGLYVISAIFTYSSLRLPAKRV